MQKTTPKRRRSERLEANELKAFKKQYNSFHTKTDAESYYGVLRQILDNVSVRGYASPESIQKIRIGLVGENHKSAA